MTTPALPRQLDRQVGGLTEELANLQRPTSPGRDGRRRVPSAVFDNLGAIVAVSPLSDEWEWSESVSLYLVAARLRVAGTSNTVVTAYRNTVPIGTVILASGKRRATLIVPTGLRDFAFGVDVLQVATTAAGAGAAGLVVYGHAHALAA